MTQPEILWITHNGIYLSIACKLPLQPPIRMKLLLATFLVLFQYHGFTQENHLKTFSGKPVEQNTCVFEIKLVDLIPEDSLHHTIVKPAVERLVDYLGACDTQFTFDRTFQDRGFRLVVPDYLCKVSYELGDQHFAIVLKDTTALGRAIVFSYDLDDRYKNHFLVHDKMGFEKTGTITLNGQVIYRFINWDDRNAGTIFSSNHLDISYFTKSKAFERELEAVISKFSW